MRIVLDTNVVVSAMLNPNGAAGSILNGVLDGYLRLLVDNRIVFEYSDVLQRKQFQFNPRDVRAIIDFVRHEAEWVAALPVQNRFEDPDDRVFYEVAVSGNADYLVTGNTQHFPERAMIRSPRQFLRIFFARE
jgi:putative PIN family toxin of toxin-antitoxin system